MAAGLTEARKIAAACETHYGELATHTPGPSHRHPGSPSEPADNLAKYFTTPAADDACRNLQPCG